MQAQYILSGHTPNITKFYSFAQPIRPNQRRICSIKSEGKTSRYMTFLKQVRLPELTVWALPFISFPSIQTSFSRLLHPPRKAASMTTSNHILLGLHCQISDFFHVDAEITLPSHLWPIIHAPPITVMTTGTLPLDASTSSIFLDSGVDRKHLLLSILGHV